MTPGSEPFEALEAALLGIAVDPPASLLEALTSGEAGIRRAVARVLPDPQAPLLLVIDQFEELFTQAAEPAALAFLDALAAAVDEPRSRLRILVTLRADFFDRPLAHRGVGELLRRGTEVITPMAPDELERAINGPAEGSGVRFEPGVVAEIVADVVDRSGALPLLQYALTELFDRRRGPVIDVALYREIGGVSGALVRRAEALFDALDPPSRDMTRQILLRMIAFGEGTEVARRRVLREELTDLGGAQAAIVLDTFGRHRLLSFDRDPVTRGPTAEIAHEALLSEWGRLRTWIDEGREDVRQQRRLATAAAAWAASAQDPAYLLRESQLDQLSAWALVTDLSLHPREWALVEASVARRDEEQASEARRQQAEVRLRRKTRQRTRLLLGGAAVLAVVVLLAAFAVIQRNDANRAADQVASISEARRLAAASSGAAASDPQLAMLLALRSLDSSAEAGLPALRESEDALHWALQSARVTFPEAGGPVDVRISADGPAGVFQMPLADLVGLARASLSRTLTDEECASYAIEPCPVAGAGLPSPAVAGPRAVPAEPPALASPTTDKPLAGTKVTITGLQSTESGALEEIARFENATGIRVDYTYNYDGEQAIQQAVESGVPPDVALLAQPGIIRDLAEGRQLVDLSTYLDDAGARKAFGDYLIDSVSQGPGWFAVPTKLDLKGLVWYPVRGFQQAGYQIPRSWAELVALSKRMVNDGGEPWCLGFEDSTSSGWLGTDWVEALVLRQSGVDVYDQWVAHEIPFDDPAIRQATATFGELAFADGFVRGGAGSISRLQVLDAANPLFAPQPGCWLYHQASFMLTHGLPPGIQAGVDTDFFVLPPTQQGELPPMSGGGNFAMAFRDRPEVRELLRFIMRPDWGAAWAAHPSSDFLPAHAGFDPERCRPEGVDPRTGDVRVRLCQVSRDSIAAGSWRFDASDLMPTAVGSDAFWKGMLDYVDEGRASLDRVLAEIEAAWAEADSGG
jgi:ABC-type glycerol-3-phosphate transport system substrate-binding protein